MQRILINDHDENRRISLRYMLERFGYEAVDAIDAEIIDKSADQGPVDLIITNLPVAEQDCARVIMDLQKAMAGWKIIGIMKSGSTFYPDATAKKLGVCGIFLIPYQLQEMLKTVDELLGYKPGGQRK